MKSELNRNHNTWVKARAFITNPKEHSDTFFTSTLPEIAEMYRTLEIEKRKRTGKDLGPEERAALAKELAARVSGATAGESELYWDKLIKSKMDQNMTKLNELGFSISRNDEQNSDLQSLFRAVEKAEQRLQQLDRLQSLSVELNEIAQQWMQSDSIEGETDLQTKKVEISTEMQKIKAEDPNERAELTDAIRKHIHNINTIEAEDPLRRQLSLCSIEALVLENVFYNEIKKQKQAWIPIHLKWPLCIAGGVALMASLALAYQQTSTPTASDDPLFAPDACPGNGLT